MNALFALRSRKIPDVRGPLALDYGAVSVDGSGLVNEPLVDIATAGVTGTCWYARADGSNYPYFRRLPGADAPVRVRAGVANRLRQVNKRLRVLGVELYCFDGWRSVETQTSIWEFYMEWARARLPRASADEVRALAGQYASDPTKFDVSDPQTWPTHLTGGAVDVTLIDSEGRPLDMGTQFDEPSDAARTSAFESTDNEEVKANRRLLYWSMTEAGFVNYSYEWWHFDFGTQLAAAGDPNSRRVVIYGPLHG